MYSTSESFIFPLRLTVQQMRTVHHEVSRLASLEYSNVFTLEEIQENPIYDKINLMSTYWVNIAIYENEHMV